MRELIICCVFLVFNCSVHSQGKIILTKYDNTACARKEATIKEKIARCNNIDSAEHILIKECKFTPGNVYILFCRECATKDMVRSSSSRSHFPAVNKDNTSGLRSKGDNKIYTLLQLRQVLSDSLAIFDSLQLDVSNMPSADKNRALTLYFKEPGSSKKYLPQINTVEGIITLSREIFGDNDRYHYRLNAFYVDAGIEKQVPGTFDIFFIRQAEKKELSNMAYELKESDKSIFSDSAGIDYLENAICGNYKKVDKESLALWLSTLKL